MTSLPPSQSHEVESAANYEQLEPEQPAARQRQPTGYSISDQYSIQENGRTYQGYDPGEYTLPNDGEEQDRLDLQHHFWLLLLEGRLGLAPVPEDGVIHVLDIGTGTGIWANEYAERNLQAQVVGTDLSQIQPPRRTPNVFYFTENSETAEWHFPCPFDYVHLRSMGPCFNDIRSVFNKAYNHMTPGGWIELQDLFWELQCLDGTTEGTALQQWFDYVQKAGQAAGRNLTKAAHFKQYLLDAGFVNVREETFVTPGSPWTKDVRMKEMGLWTGRAMWISIDSYRKFLGASGLSQEQIDALSNAAQEELKDLGIHWFLQLYVVYGRKPHPGEVGRTDPAVADSNLESVG